MTFDQNQFDLRFEWGSKGAEVLAATCDAVVVVDVLSFSTAVTAAVSRGVRVYPYRLNDGSRITFAEQKKALLAAPRGTGTSSLSPLSLLRLNPGQDIVLPSPNGATVSLVTGDTPTFAGCLRNAEAVADAMSRAGTRLGVIGCGERWREDRSLRPSLEDMLGAGAILSCLTGSRSPEASAAIAVFDEARKDLRDRLRACSSGRELVAGGFADDVDFAAAVNANAVAPVLVNGAYQDTSASDLT